VQRNRAANRPQVLRVHLFGHFRIDANGVPYPIATHRKTLPLMAYLLLHRNAAVQRDFLSFLLWPDESEEAARAKLRATLHELLRGLPVAPEGHWIVNEGARLRWNPDAKASLDVEEFEAAVADPQRLEEAIALYTGDLLEALYDEWIVAPRERLRSAYLGALGQLTSRFRRRLEYSQAIAYAKRLLDAEPLREDVARRLIALRYEAGDRAGALDEYERFERRVREELGLDPMPETASLREAIVRNGAVAADEAPSEEESLARATQANLPFVGRQDEMEQLLGGWSRAARARGGIAFIGGDPGIGKSRLVAEFAHEVDERGGRVLVGATGSPETMPYQAFVEALRSSLPLVASLNLEGVWFSTLATLLPELTARIGDLPVLPHIERDHDRARLFGALARALQALAQPRPLLLVLEDLHWAEEGTIAALAFLARRVALSPIFVVATYRDDEAAQRHPLRRLRQETTIHGVARSLSLRPLSVGDVEQLVQHLDATAPGSAAALHASSGGNPLLLGQLLEEPADAGLDRAPHFDAIIEARLGRLSPEARAIAEIAALIGQRFSRETVRDVGGWDESTFSDALDELLDRRLVREATGRGAFDYAFAHQMVCEVVARGAAPERSADRHRRIARTLEHLYPERRPQFAAELARHYELAGDANAAAVRYLAAARHAVALAALDEARAHVDRGLSLAAQDRLRADLLVEREGVTTRAGDNAGREATLDQLAALAEALDDDEYRRTASLLRVRFAIATDDEAGQRDALSRLRALVADAGPRWRAALLLEEARIAYGHGDLESVETAATAALAAARENGDEASAARALVRLSDVELHGGRFSEARAFLEQAQAAAALARDGAVEIACLGTSFLLTYNTADVEGCIATSERWLERGIALGDRHAEAEGRMRVGVALLSARRDIARVREEFSRAIAIFEEVGSQRGIAGLLVNRGILENECGDFAAATADTERAVEIFAAIENNRGKGAALANLAQLRTMTGDPLRGCREAKAALEIARASALRIQEANALENLAIATAALGDVAEAVRLGSEALLLYRKTESEKWSGRLLGDLALWHAQLGDIDAARRLVDEMLAPGVRVWTEWPQRFHWAAAQVLRWCGEGAGAHRELVLARGLVADLAAELTGEKLACYESIPWNRAIVGAHDGGVWPAPVSARPAAGPNVPERPD
jgi:DNA-binding SARP family transcriptional activator